jgi:diguanylate cyclase (GGDEF)-like protein
VVVALVALPALGVMVYGDLQQRHLAAAEVRRAALVQARAATADEQRLITDTRQFLTLLAHLPEIRADSQTCGAFLADLLSRDELYANFGVIDADGRIRCSAVPSPLLNLSFRSYFRRAVEARDFAIGDYQIGLITGIAVLNFGYPVLTDSGDIEAVLFAALPLTWLQEHLAEADLPPGSEVLIVDPSLHILARFPELSEVAGRSLADLPLGKMLRASSEETLMEVDGWDGVRRLYATRRLREAPGGAAVTVSVGIPISVAYGPADRAFTRNLLLLAFAVVLISIFTWWSSGILVLRPVRSLVVATRKLGAGDLSVRAPQVESRNEVDELAKSFNEMADMLESRASEVREHLVRIQRLNRVYAVLSGINGLILRIRERETLMREVCRLAVQVGGFAAAWIGEIDAGTGELRPVAQEMANREHPAGSDPPDPEDLAVFMALAEAARRTGRDAIANDLLSDRRTEAGREELRSLGFRSAAALPLLISRQVIGVLQLFSGNANFFDEDEIRLLRDLAADTSLGLEYIEKEKRLHFLANFDPLTELPNLALFTDRLEQAIAKGTSRNRLTAVLVLEIDRFQEIGATLGRQAADLALQEAARYLLRTVDEGDTVARFGSGQFGIALPDLSDLREVEVATNRILAGTPDALHHEGEEIHLEFHVGVAVAPHDGSNAEAILKAATLALEIPRPANLSPITFYSAELDAQAQARRKLEHELRFAMERGELTLYYQPVVSIPERKIVGVEALLRWHCQELGDISPADFIPVAEESGIIMDIGEWILGAVAKQSRRWTEQGLGIRLNVNVSVHQLRDPDFVERAVRILEGSASEPPPLGLGIEITESELMENVLRAAGSISRLKSLGLMIYIDDFGTGYSSLSYLRTLDVDALKIDQSFIRDMPDDADAVAVVRSIIALAQSLGLLVIAEGVETEGQLAVLRELGCDSAQGYLFGRAMLAREIEELLRAGPAARS